MIVAIWGVWFAVHQYLERRKYEGIDWLAEINKKDLLIKEFERKIDAFKKEETQKCGNKIQILYSDLAKRGGEKSGAMITGPKALEKERDDNIFKMETELNLEISKLNVDITALRNKITLQPKWQKRLDKILFKSKDEFPIKKHMGV